MAEHTVIFYLPKQDRHAFVTQESLSAEMAVKQATKVARRRCRESERPNFVACLDKLSMPLITVRTLHL